MLILIAEALTEYNNMNYFYGYLGIAFALVFASIPISPYPRHRICLRHCTKRSGDNDDGRAETGPDNKVGGASGYGGDIGDLWTDH